MKEIMADRRDALLQPSPSEGIYELRAAICSHLKEFRGMNVHPEQIIIGAGTDIFILSLYSFSDAIKHLRLKTQDTKKYAKFIIATM